MIKNPSTLPKPPDNKFFSIKVMPKLTPYSLPPPSPTSIHTAGITFSIPHSFRSLQIF